MGFATIIAQKPGKSEISTEKDETLPQKHFEKHQISRSKTFINARLDEVSDAFHPQKCLVSVC
jgi:hypothetical protein